MDTPRQEAQFAHQIRELWSSGNYKAVSELYAKRFRENVQKAKDVQEKIETFFSGEACDKLAS
jgi:hypothetical protein